MVMKNAQEPMQNGKSIMLGHLGSYYSLCLVDAWSAFDKQSLIVPQVEHDTQSISVGCWPCLAVDIFSCHDADTSDRVSLV